MSAATLLDTRYFLRAQHAADLVHSPSGLEMRLDTGDRLRVEVLRADVLRIKISRHGFFDEQPTHAVLDGSLAALGGNAAFSVSETPDNVLLTTERIKLTVGKSPFQLDAHRADGSLIFESAEDANGQPWTYATLNDEFLVSRRRGRNDAFYGLGEKSGGFDRQDRDFILWNTDILNPNVETEYRAKYPEDDPRGDPRSAVFDPYYVSIPFFYHQPAGQSAMAGFFFDNRWKAGVALSNPNQYLLHFSGGQYTEYVFAGPDMREILRDYTTLTGRMPPPPLWALGHHQCRWFPYTQPALEVLGTRYREESGVPCDTLWLDIDYMDGYRVFTWNKTRFPDPQAMLARLRAQGFRVVTIIDPGVKYEPGYPVFDAALDAGLLCRTAGGAVYVGQVWPGRTAFPDFSLEQTRRWWGGLNAAHVRSGLAGIWNDMNEPATGDVPADAMRFDHARQPHESLHNEYALLMAMGTVEGLLAEMPGQRTFVLTRAGSPGIQRYAANWLGDNCSRWEHLQMSIPMAMGFGVSGQPFVGADVGGFTEDTNPELLARWYQYGALTPFCRNHNCADQHDQYPWSYGEATLALCRAAILQRYRLMPYLYACFLEAAATGAPVQRPLIFDYQDDEATRGIDDQYLLGRDLLVAPVCRAGQTSRRVYLPPGTWYAWHGAQAGQIFAGPRWIDVPTPLESIPLYARAGAVIPMWADPPMTTMDYHPDAVELHVLVPREDGVTRSFLHEDDGTTFAFRDGAFRRTDFLLERSGDDITLSATVTGQGYPEFARREFVVVLGHTIGEAVAVDGTPYRLSGDRFRLPNAGMGFTLRAQINP